MTVPLAFNSVAYWHILAFRNTLFLCANKGNAQNIALTYPRHFTEVAANVGAKAAIL